MALIVGVGHFHQYLYGRKFTLVTDHRPLCKILGEKESSPPLAAARMHCYSVLIVILFSIFLVNLIIVWIICHIYLALLAAEIKLKKSMQW